MLQYIGARYVPIFYQNSLDPTSSEWEANVTYEPLTWVSLPNGHMYISKKEVPSNTGTPASNPDYWLEAGQYNAYIQSLQDQIDNMKDTNVVGSLQNQIDTMNDGNVSGSLQNQIDDINNTTIPAIQTDIADINKKINRKILFIGDSIGLSVNASNKNMYQLAGGYLGLIENSDFYCYSISSRGFTTGSLNHPATFEAMLNKFFTDHPTLDPTTLTDIVVMGGPNDINSSASTISNAISSFISTAKTYNPNVTVRVGISSKNTVNLDGINKYRNNYLPGYRDCYKYGGVFMQNSEYVLYNNSLTTDKLHPNADGVNALGKAIFECLTAGKCKVFSTIAYDSNNTSLGANVASMTNIGVFNESITDNVVMLTPATVGNVIITLTSAWSGGAMSFLTTDNFIACATAANGMLMSQIPVSYKDTSNATHELNDCLVYKSGPDWTVSSPTGFTNCKEITIKRPCNMSVLSDLC